MTDIRMPRLHVGQGTHRGALSVFPVWAEAAEVRGLDTGTAARVEAAERDGAPVVGELVLTNKGSQPALLLAGELFEGGWQHRSLNYDLVLLPQRDLVASVCCVEHGRWHGSTDQVRRARRASVMVRSAQAISAGGDRQQQVWERVSRYDTAFGPSATASYVDHLDRRPHLAAAGGGTRRPGTGRLRPLAGQRGVLIGLGGQPAFLELFPSAAALRGHLPGLLEAADLDAALLPPVPTPGRRARRFIERLTPAPLPLDAGTDAGAGHALATRTAYHEIRALAWADQLVHATMFNSRHPVMEPA